MLTFKHMYEYVHYKIKKYSPAFRLRRYHFSTASISYHLHGLFTENRPLSGGALHVKYEH